MKCKGFQYEIGKEYKLNDTIVMCEQGFHFCKELIDVMNFYNTEKGNRFCEIEAIGEIVEDNEHKKYCTNKIKIIKEIPIEEVLKKVNTGNCNTGNYNTGDYNTGDCNTGLFNTDEPNARLFNKISNVKMSDIDIGRINYILNFIDKRDVKLIWKYTEDMTAEEKEKYPEYTTTGGALMKIEVKVNVQEEWEKVRQDDKDFIKSLPNFDKDIFYECTGIKV